jgi:hypothetical protein
MTHLHETPKLVKFRETEIRKVAARGRREREE